MRRPYQGGMRELIRRGKGNLSWGMKNIPSLAPLRKGGADEVNTPSFAPLRKGGADVVSRGVEKIYFVLL